MRWAVTGADQLLVQLDDVGVRYRLPRSGVRSIKEYALLALRGRLEFDDFWALKDVNLRVHEGERLGVIGRNGAGKSTLLQLIARVVTPSSGTVRVNGRVAPLLQLGAGFDAELSGRENVFLNGSLLGMSRAMIRNRFEAIVDFAELGPFIDAPLRTYSTGMAARLGFAVATECDPDILLLDEVLSVGDEAFQAKCVERLRSFTRVGTTMIVVTHNPEFVLEECTRAIWLHDKQIQSEGDPLAVVAAYHEHLTASEPVAHVDGLSARV
jgi:ABC-type polysaccharide/polyol phosphate transport system ATPase subunit